MSLSSSYLPVPAAQPLSGWPTRSAFHVMEHVSTSEHLVQLYETEPYLVACASRFLGHSLRAGGGALVLTAPEHRQGIEAALDLEEICAGAASRRGQYLALDPERALDTITAAGRADAAAFRHSVGKRLAELSRRWHQVRVFDETGPLLWQGGRHREGAALERAWSAAGRRHPFARLSGYPTCGLTDDSARSAFSRLCAGPVRVLPPQRSIESNVLRALRAPRAAPPRTTHRRRSKGDTAARRTAR